VGDTGDAPAAIGRQRSGRRSVAFQAAMTPFVGGMLPPRVQEQHSTGTAFTRIAGYRLGVN